MRSVALRVPHEDPWKVFGTLWRRTFPEKYEEIKIEAEILRKGDHPFAEPFNVPDEELTPSSFAPLTDDWARGLPWKVFSELGHPVSIDKDPDNGNPDARLFWSHETGVFEIYHTPEAIAAFRQRFPEFQPISEIPGEQAESLKP